MEEIWKLFKTDFFYVSFPFAAKPIENRIHRYLFLIFTLITE